MRLGETQEEVSKLYQNLQDLKKKRLEYIHCMKTMNELQKKLANLIGSIKKGYGSAKRIYLSELAELLSNVSEFMQKMGEPICMYEKLDREHGLGEWLIEFQSSIETYSDSMYCVQEFVEKYMIKLAAARCNLPLCLVFLHHEFKPHELLNTMISRCSQIIKVLKGVEVLRDRVEQGRQQAAGKNRGMMVRSSSDPVLSTRSDSLERARYMGKRM